MKRSEEQICLLKLLFHTFSVLDVSSITILNIMIWYGLLSRIIIIIKEDRSTNYNLFTIDQYYIITMIIKIDYN